MKSEIVVPYAPILVESTRSIGYSFEEAVADIIDNSISAAASEIHVRFSSNDPQWLSVEDNGWGMTVDELSTAMRYGSQSSTEERRKDDLGRFGLGLKTASLSQCRSVTVITKKNDVISAARWDIDYIVYEKKDWALQFFSDSEIEKMQGYEYLSSKASGTVVIWEQFDRLKQGAHQIQKAFDEKIELARKYVSLVFHRFINDENPRKRLAIYFNEELVKGIDPFLTKHPATQPLSEQVIRIASEEIRVKPYVIPYMSKLSKQDIEAIGGKDELRQRQGFYIYRNRRLIIWGTWFRLTKQNELGKLARVRVDIPNSLDDIWDIDIKKSKASLPHFIKKNLADIVANTVGRSERVYKYRGRNVQTDNLVHVWNPIDDRGKFKYQINTEIPIVKMIEKHLDDDGSTLFSTFIKMIEDAFPYSDVYYRIAKNETNVAEGVMETNDVYAMAEQMVQEIDAFGGDVKAFLKTMDKLDFFIKYPDVVSQIREVFGDD